MAEQGTSALKVGVEFLLNPADGGKKEGQPTQGEEFTGNRDENEVAGDKGVEGEEAQGR